MTYEFQNKQRKQIVDSKFNMLIDKTPHLINALDRSVNHPLLN